MMKKRNLRLMLVLCVALGLLMTGCASTGNKDVTDGKESTNKGSDTQKEEKSGSTETRDTLIYGMNQEPAKLDPQNDTLLVSLMTCKQLYDTLLVKDDITGEIKPSLATEWEWIDDTTLHMTLRDDVTFHDGEKLTADDVIYTLGRCATGVTANLFTSFDAEASKAIDDTHVEIKMKEPYAAAINMLCNTKSAIVSKKYAESVDENTFARQPIGSGPFVFSEWTSGDNIILKRNDNYWDEKATVSTVKLRILTDATARAIELETGGVDIIDTMNVADIKRMQESSEMEASLVGGNKIHYLVFNEKHEILSQEKVRLAIAHAVNVTNVADAGFGDSADVAKTSMASTIWGYKEQGLYEHNIEKAKELMAEAGYADGFTCTLAINNMPSNIRMVETIQAYLSEIGITMNIETYDAATWMSMCRAGSTDLTISNLTVDSFDPDQNYMNLKEDSSMAVVRSTDTKLNELLKAGKTETDETKRRAIYEEVQEYIFDHAIIIPIDEPIINYGLQSYVKGFVPNANVQPDLKLVYFE